MFVLYLSLLLAKGRSLLPGGAGNGIRNGHQILVHHAPWPDVKNNRATITYLATLGILVKRSAM